MDKHIKRLLLSLGTGLIFGIIMLGVNSITKSDNWVYNSIMQKWTFTLGVWVGIGLKDLLKD